jgi:hypothetical protein
MLTGVRRGKAIAGTKLAADYGAYIVLPAHRVHGRFDLHITLWTITIHAAC